MTLRYSEELRNAGLDARITAVGPSPTLHILDGGGKELVLIRLPALWMGKADKGIAQKRGSWTALASVSGRPTSFEIKSAKGDSHIDGKIPEDMTLDSPTVQKGQSILVGNFILAAGNARESAH